MAIQWASHIRWSVAAGGLLAMALTASACAVAASPEQAAAATSTIALSTQTINSSSTPLSIGPSTPAGTLEADTPAWAAQGVSLIAEQKENPPVGVVNTTPFAYLSDAFDVSGDGTYDAVFHVPSSFSITPKGDQGISLGYAFPDDRGFIIRPSGAPKLVQSSSGYDLHIPFYASNVTFDYKNFSVWLHN
jgi:hypothetical protein